jgi:hypothetical protein
MHLTPVQDQAIAARMALIVGAVSFDRLLSSSLSLMAPFCMFTRSTSIERRRSRRRLPSIYRLSQAAFLSATFP